jgi:hypothetical protein
MKSQGKMGIIGACLASLLLLAFCETVAARPPARGPAFRPGPPAHAPAYGARRKQVGSFELVFDVKLGLYVAVGVTDVYYHQGYFYRVRGGVWEISLRGDVWGPVVIEKLPPGLQVKAKSMVKLNGNGNSLVKLNGNGNSLVKLNGNAGGNDNKGNAGPDGNGNKSNPGTAGSANKPDGNGAKVNGDGGGNSDKAGKSDASANGAKANADAAGKPGTSKPNGRADASAKPDGNGSKPDDKPADKGKTSSAPKGKKK